MAYNSYNNSSNATIELYTLEDAREILRKEARQKRLAKQRREARIKAKRKAKFLYYLKQKALGAGLIAMAFITPILLDGDATASIFFLPMGIYIFFTREKVLY